MSRTPDEPAMNTIVLGLLAVLAFYIVQISLVAWWLGREAAALYGASLPLSVTWDFHYADRLRRGAARVRTYFRLRQDASIHQRLHDDLICLRGEAIALDALIATTLNWGEAAPHIDSFKAVLRCRMCPNWSGSRDLTKVRSQMQRREKPADKVPMPCVSPKSCSRIFQWLELEPLGRESDLPSVGE